MLLIRRKATELVSTGASRHPLSAAGAVASCLFVLLLATASPARAQAQVPADGAVFNGEIVAREDERGFARLVLRFPKPIEFERTLANGVLVLSLEDAVDVDLSGIALSVPGYIAAARSDPGGRSLRFALAQRLTVSVLPAAERLFVDLLPESWTGPPPTLPAEVLAELAERAREAERRKKRGDVRSYASGVPLTLRIGRYPTFSRIVFEWNDAVNTTLSRSGSSVKVRFDRPGDVDLTRLNVDPPPNVRGADMTTEDGQTEIDINVAIGADVRGFKEDTSYVLDVSTDDGLGLDSLEEIDTGQVGPSLPPVPTGAEVIRLSGSEEALAPVEPVRAEPEPDPAPETPSATEFATSMADPNEVLPPGMPTGDVEISVTPLRLGEPEPATPPGFDPSVVLPGGTSEAAVPAAQSAGQPPAPSDAPQPRVDAAQPSPETDEDELPDVEANDAMADSRPEPRRSEPDSAEDGAAALASQTPDPGREAASSTPASIFDDPDPNDLTASLAREAGGDGRSVEARIVGETLRIRLPFGDKVAGAVLQRAATLWMVFDTDTVLDVAPIRKSGADRVEDVSVVRSGRMQIIRIKLKRRYLATAAPGLRDWVVSIGDLVLDPTTPVALERALRTDGRSKVVAKLPDNGQVHWISDSEIGDQIAVVTAHGPARGLIKRQEFVEFVALPTAHGLAFQPIADDLAVRIAHTEVVVTRDGGLTVSSARWPMDGPDRRGAGDGTRPGFVDFEDWSQGGAARYRANVNRIMTALSEMETEQRAAARLELARLFLANDLGAEARGALRVAASEDPEIVNDPVFRAMRGVANLFMHHLQEADRDLSVQGLSADPHSALWRGVVFAREGKWRQAQLSLEDGSVAMDAYPPARQAVFRLAGLRSALMVNDLESAARHMDALPESELDGEARREATLLRGMLALALGQSEQALTFFGQAESGRWGQAAAEARFRRISLARKLGRMQPGEAISALETLAIVWRGDDIELEVLNRLAELLIGAGDYRRALDVMRTAVVVHNGKPRADQIRDEMGRLFENLFLDGGADGQRPLDALALYYEFRELTPVGRRGDEMIRKLARRLIEVDLLVQAAELLHHQVENRLTGAARAQVAADLALVYLMDHKPDLALRAIRRTRQAVLPRSLQQKRNTLEARALAELGQVEVAIELLDSMEGEDIEAMKADALWRGKRWQAAGEQIESILSDIWQSGGEFTDDVRFEVMRASISYALAQDRAGLQRVRRKFVDQMATTPDAVRFDVVTKVGERNEIEFSNLAAEFAEIDTLETFLKTFRERYGQAGDEALEESPPAG